MHIYVLHSVCFMEINIVLDQQPVSRTHCNCYVHFNSRSYKFSFTNNQADVQENDCLFIEIKRADIQLLKKYLGTKIFLFRMKNRE